MKLMTPLLACWFLGFSETLPAPSQEPTSKTRVLVVTGGHDFEREPFFKLFADNSEIAFRAVEHPHAQALFRPEAADDYDVLVLYDMYQTTTDQTKTDFINLLKKGKGLVVLHHAIASYQQWPEYEKIIGAHYYLEDTTVNGVKKPRSIYEHEVHFKVQVADPSHPVTKGIKDYEIQDETYNLFDVANDSHALLTTPEPKSNKVIGWCKTYEKARVVYLQSGHDHFAYENPNYQQILRQAIRWTAGRS